MWHHLGWQAPSRANAWPSKLISLAARFKALRAIPRIRWDTFPAIERALWISLCVAESCAAAATSRLRAGVALPVLKVVTTPAARTLSSPSNTFYPDFLSSCQVLFLNKFIDIRWQFEIAKIEIQINGSKGLLIRLLAQNEALHGV